MNETTKEALDNLWMHIYEDIDHCLAPHLMNDILTIVAQKNSTNHKEIMNALNEMNNELNKQFYPKWVGEEE